MKTKLVGILISLMLLTTICATATTLYTTPNKTQTQAQTSATMVDVPVWEVGDTWTYSVDDISIEYTTDSQSILLHGSLSELPLEVTSTTGEYYTLQFSDNNERDRLREC